MRSSPPVVPTDVVDVGDRSPMVGEAYRSVTLMALLFSLWGAVSLAAVPGRPFVLPNVFQAVVGAAALIYFIATRARPRILVAAVFSALVMAYSLVLLPWTALVWCDLGRPWEAFTVPQMAMIGMALVIPRFLWLGMVLIGLFAVDAFFVYFHARAVGLGALLPVGEPYISLCFALIGVALLVMRERRREVTQRYIRVQAESEALRRLGPMFAAVREQLESQLVLLSVELQHLQTCPASGGPVPRMVRAVGRLGAVSGRLDRLVQLKLPAAASRDRGAGSASTSIALDPAERRFLDAEAHAGATIFVSSVAFLAVMRIAFGGDPQVFAPSFGALVGLALLCLAWLRRTRSRPSERTAFAVILLVYGAALPISSGSDWYLATRDHHPFPPFLGHKVFMVLVALVAGSRFRLTFALILATALEALALYAILDLANRRDVISVAEPWVTVVYMVIGIVVLVMGEQRRLTSLRTLRAESERASLHRRAGLFLALRDQLNSPLQALVLCATQLELQAQAATPSSPIRASIDRLIALSHRLAGAEHLVPHATQRVSLDGDGELIQRE